MNSFRGMYGTGFVFTTSFEVDSFSRIHVIRLNGKFGEYSGELNYFKILVRTFSRDTSSQRLVSDSTRSHPTSTPHGMRTNKCFIPTKLYDSYSIDVYSTVAYLGFHKGDHSMSGP